MSFKNADYFVSMEENQNEYIVYVKYMSSLVFSEIPQDLSGKRVLVHFDSSKKDLSLSYLKDSLNELRAAVGGDYVRNIFFECHDQDNAITNLSMKYPHIRLIMDELYADFGYDVIFENL